MGHLVINCETGEETTIPLTPEELVTVANRQEAHDVAAAAWESQQAVAQVQRAAALAAAQRLAESHPEEDIRALARGFLLLQDR